MIEELKRRIEMINCGKVPEGYKKTEMGIVPVEWNETMLRDLLDFKNGINADKEKFGSGIKLIGVMDILDNSPITYESIRGAIDIDRETLEKYSVTYGDILFQRSSENFDDAGKSNVYLDKNNIATYSGFVIRGKKIAEYEPFYLNELLKIQNVRKQIIRLSAGSQHINIGQESLAQISINMAEASEQEKIAEILMKWDKVVTLLEKLIEKLEAQKKALMQKLLAPKETWKSVRVGSVVKEISIKNKINCKNVMSVSNKFGFIKQEEQFTKQVASEDVKNYKIVSEGDIAYNPSRINVGSIAIYQYKEIGIVSPMYVVFRCTKISPKLLLLLLSTSRGKYDIESFLSGSVRDSLSFSDLAEIEIKIPSEPEQKNIVKIFNAIDKRILMYNEKLAKYKEQQKSMMQLLLTGIVRVNKGVN